MASGSDFIQALRQTYLQNPCQVLPNPLWQTLPRLNDFELSSGFSGEVVNRLEAWNEHSIYVYWRKDNRQPSLLVRRRLESVQLALMHQDFLDSPTVAGFAQTRQPYFRLLHDHAEIPQGALPDGFRFDSVQFPLERDRVLAMIAHADGDGKPGTDTVESWLLPPVYEADFWLWVKDTQIGAPVALAAGVLDREIGEAVLTWVQVIPAYQGRGLAAALVSELLGRSAAKARFTTVSSVFDFRERENPGGFFRQFGFAGADVWWLLSR